MSLLSFFSSFKSFLTAAVDRVNASTPSSMQQFPTPCKITRYGYPTDNFKDSNSSNAIGCYDNKLDSMSLAVSPDIHSLFTDAGIKLGNFVRLYFSTTNSITRRWDDLTANDHEAAKLNLPPLRGRLDLFCPKGENKQLDGKAIIGFQKA